VATFLLTSSGANRRQLSDELVAAIPALTPTPTGPDGRNRAHLIIAQVTATQLMIITPDGVTEPEVEAIVTAHVPEVDPPNPWMLALARMRDRADAGDELAADVLILVDAPTP
jgi:hypothetical protein